MDTNKQDAQILACSDVETWSYNMSDFDRIDVQTRCPDSSNLKIACLVCDLTKAQQNKPKGVHNVDHQILCPN